jgi:8-oxo-dGTP pyrophosphatase MutT (NUDIX family)
MAANRVAATRATTRDATTVNDDTPRLAATVILARPAPNRLEIYMTRRSAHSAFAPDAFVFPGGTVDPQDFAERTQARTLGLEQDRFRGEFRAHVPPELPTGESPPVDDLVASGLLVAALRELFEEAGILIARTSQGAPVDARQLRSAAVRRQRIRVRNGELGFADFLESREWFADARALTLFSHWITPPSEPRRYNTHFFFACAPADQAGRADAFETHDGIWIAPGRALDQYHRDRFHLVYATIKHLERLAAFDSVESALAFARSKRVLTIMPTTTTDAGFEIPAPLENAW